MLEELNQTYRPSFFREINFTNIFMKVKITIYTQQVYYMFYFLITHHIHQMQQKSEYRFLILIFFSNSNSVQLGTIQRSHLLNICSCLFTPPKKNENNNNNLLLFFSRENARKSSAIKLIIPVK